MVNHKELISVIVPVYNASRYLDVCIQSILSQTYALFELILVDDGSKDNSLEICKLYQKKDNRIIVIHQENAGVSVARNIGLSVMKGQYFCFVDSDDSIESDMLEKLYDAICINDAELAICGFKSISKKGIRECQALSENIIGKENIAIFVLEHYLEWLVSSPWGKLYRNVPFSTRSFDLRISLGEDLKFNIQYFEKIKKITVIEDCLYRYMDAEGSLTKTYKEGNYEAMCDIYDITIQYIKRIFGSIDEIDLTKVNYKLFSFCISFMSQNIVVSSIKQEKAFISKICSNVSLQYAIGNLPSISLIRKLYVWGIKKKYINYLCFLSLIKSIVYKR